MIPIIDAHLDLAWNAVSFNRDLTLEVSTLRQLEAHMVDEPNRGKCTTRLPELKKARIPLCVLLALQDSVEYVSPSHALHDEKKLCFLFKDQLSN